MSRPTVTLLAALLLAAATGPGFAAERPFTLDPTPRTPQEGWRAVPGAAVEFLIEADPEVIAANPEAVLLDLPSGPPLEVTRRRFDDYGPEWKSWFGSVHLGGSGHGGGLEVGSVYLGYHGSQLTGLLDLSGFGGGRFRIVGGIEGPHRLVRIAEDRLDHALCPLDSPPDLGQTLRAATLPTGPEAATETENDLAALDFTAQSTRLDVIAVYPDAYFSFPTSEVSLFNFIEDSIALGNDAFNNSNIPAYYNLRYIGPITGAQPPSTGLIGGLNWLNTDPSEVTSLRNAFGADIVTLYIPYIWDDDPYCGVANLPEANGTIVAQLGIIDRTFGNRAFTVNRQSCGFGDYTLAHEIGHNYGMRHETDSTGSSHLFPTGRGHDLTSLGKSSVMACTCSSGCTASSSAVCNRIPYFSDPAISYMGVATGTSNRNNANVGRAQDGPYSNFKPVSSNMPPTASFTVSCCNSTCTFNASGSSDNTTIPSSGYWWDFGDGTTGSGKIVNKSYSFGTFFWVHLVVTDSGGQKDLGIDIANPNSGC